MLYLIGGAPRTGKSTLARLIGEKINLTPIATDDLRTQLRATIPASTEPGLYYLDSLNADEANMTRLMREHTADIIAAADRESAIVWRAVAGLIEHSTKTNQDLLIEGVAVLPHLVARLDIPHTVVHLGNQSKAHTQIILDYARADPHSWLGSLETDTVQAFAEFTQAYSRHAQKAARNHHQPYIEMGARSFKESLALAGELLDITQ